MPSPHFRAQGDAMNEETTLETIATDDSTCPPYSRRQVQPTSIDVYAVDWLIFKSSTIVGAGNIPEIRLMGIYPTIAQARQAAGFGSLNLRLIREHRLSAADYHALDERRRALQAEGDVGPAGVVIPVIRRCEYFID